MRANITIRGINPLNASDFNGTESANKIIAKTSKMINVKDVYKKEYLFSIISFITAMMGIIRRI